MTEQNHKGWFQQQQRFETGMSIFLQLQQLSLDAFIGDDDDLHSIALHRRKPACGHNVTKLHSLTA